MRTSRTFNSCFVECLLLIWALLISPAAISQNLVPNGSFEEFSSCPTGLGQVSKSEGWSIISQSPDYFNRCDVDGMMGVPLSTAGYQEPYEGDAYMGMATYNSNSATYRECIQQQLITPLVPGIPVHISMMVSLGGYGSVAHNSARYASSGIGMKFSMQSHSTWSIWPGNIAIYLDSVLTDTVGWTLLSGEYIPDSAYAFVAVGCFLPDEHIVVVNLSDSGTLPGAYSFVDAVCVSANAEDCSRATGLKEEAPTLGMLSSTLSGEELHLRVTDLAESGIVRLCDLTGRTHWVGELPLGSSEVRLSLTDLSDGPYLILLETDRPFRQALRFFHISP